ncbi:ferric-dicitrate binding protein FerR, regulates iron transport through sigma-19 [Chitinophaga eiseniae]|uniref:Ferric-dicitrate binding protein FerR, regulates iron transport through sigma-19 n=1 Tax=Chitinophaga eiseniae TaxID=634771 RepID=A0A1T4NXP5_9BACT|nr:FecR domain-containing protein [Chitinophaga eiseniae]SJZ83816.1 ferric-dicitrate binding protein FerR, regulates iron transport through sigma-19 [Chitinophaga eiseniae]
MAPIDRALLEKYFNGECTPEEENLVYRWLDENDLDAYPDVHNERKHDRKRKKGWEKLSRLDAGLMALPAPGSTAAPRGRWWMAAAMLIVLLGGGLLYFNYFRGYEKEYSTSFGEVRTFRLADGTTVTLNACSALKIRRGFGRKHRDVQLQGEACFDIHGQPGTAFTVYTGKLSVTALGTAFNVTAFADGPQIIVSLANGKVRVAKENTPGTVLAPGEEIVYSTKDDQLKKEKFDYRKRFAWKQMIIYFDNANIDEVLAKLERFYGVQFDINQLKSRQWRLTGEYSNPALQEVLESLSFNYDFKYRIEAGKIILFDR